MTANDLFTIFQAQDKEQSSTEGFTSSENDEELERELKRKARNKKVKMICVFDFIFTVDITNFFNLQKRFDTRDREDLVNDIDFEVDAEAVDPNGSKGRPKPSFSYAAMAKKNSGKKH